MKQFIYLDTDIVNSIIAQEEKGLIKNMQMEQKNTLEENKSDSITTEMQGETKGSILNIVSAEAKIKTDAKIEKENDISNTTRKMIEKTLHDAAFDSAYTYIKAKKIQTSINECPDYGEYVELTRKFDFVDFNYLDGLFSKDGVIDYLKNLTKGQIKKELLNKSTDQFNREQRRAISNKTINDEVKKIADEENKKYDDVAEAINAFKKMIPYGRMLISCDGYLIPLDENYFRVNPTSIGFMYGGNITCVGMITNIITKRNDQSNKQNVFANLQFSVNEALRSILPTKEDDIYVMHPIAVYYDKEGEEIDK